MTNEQILKLEKGTKLVITEDEPWGANLFKGDIVILYKKAKKDCVNYDGNLILHVKDKDDTTWGICSSQVELVDDEKESKTMTNEQLLELEEGTKLVITVDEPWYIPLGKGEVVTLYEKAEKDFTDEDGNLIFCVKDKDGEIWEVCSSHVKLADDEKKSMSVSNNALEIKIKFHDDELIKPEKISKGDLIDLRAAEDVEMKAGDFKLISLGVSMKLPDGWKAQMYPRSSTFKNFGIIQANSVGQIDNSYSGTNDIWKFPAIALRDTVIHKNDRICQFEIVPIQPRIRFTEVQVLDDEDRGGIGSTGKN